MKNALNHYKNNNGCNFFCQKWPAENLSVVDFHSQPRELPLPKPLIRKFRLFFLVFWFSFPPRKVRTSLSVAIRIFQCFSSHNPKKIPTNNRGLRMVKALPFIHQPDRVARKASDVSAAD